MKFKVNINNKRCITNIKKYFFHGVQDKKKIFVIVTTVIVTIIGVWFLNIESKRMIMFQMKFGS